MKMMRRSCMKKKIPAFRTEDEERLFWAKESPLDYFDMSRAAPTVFPNLKPTMRSISLRLPVDMLETLKVLANRQDVPYQSLIKTYLGRQIMSERRMLRGRRKSRGTLLHPKSKFARAAQRMR
jgi:predicted DNA binding CopG/RHH family protein